MADNLTINKGTTFTINGVYQEAGIPADITGATVYFTVKSDETDADNTDTSAVISKNISSFNTPLQGLYTISLTPADTNIAAGSYFYDIKIKKASGATYKLVEGKCKVDGSPTNRNVS